MTETIEPMPAQIDQQQRAQDLVDQARSEGLDLVGPARVADRVTKTVLETALEAEMSEHLGYDRYDAAGRKRGNSRNGTRTKTMITEVGPMDIEMPRDWDKLGPDDNQAGELTSYQGLPRCRNSTDGSQPRCSDLPR